MAQKKYKISMVIGESNCIDRSIFVKSYLDEIERCAIDIDFYPNADKVSHIPTKFQLSIHRPLYKHLQVLLEKHKVIIGCTTYNKLQERGIVFPDLNLYKKSPYKQPMCYFISTSALNVFKEEIEGKNIFLKGQRIE